MIIAPKLKKGDSIGVFSASTPISATEPTRYNRAKNYLSAKGFNIVEGKLTGKQDFYRSGSINERADEFNQLIYNKNIQCIMSTIGGMVSNSILPYIDYEALSKNPKIIIGYSDTTALLFAIYNKAKLITYYGPALVASFGELPPFVDESFEYFSNIVTDNAMFPQTLPTPKFWTEEFIPWASQDRSKIPIENKLITINSGKVRGRLIGGNLNTMYGIWGSEYMIKIKEGDILLIEDSLKDISLVERSFSMLKLNGIFDKIAGLIIGKHEGFNSLGSGRIHLDVLIEVIGKLDIPILAEFDSCHTHPMLTFPIGAYAELDADNKKVTIIKEKD